MKKIIIMIISPMLFLFIIWTIIALQRYGDDIVNHHLNLEGMIKQLANVQINFSMIDVIQNLIDYINQIHNLTLIGNLVDGVTLLFNVDIIEPFKTIIRVVAEMLNPITSLCILFYSIVNLTIDLTVAFIGALNLILQILNFIFNPMFI